jgi:hypothetical protein
MVGITHRMQGLSRDIAGLLHGHNPQLPQQSHDFLDVFALDGPLQQDFDHPYLLISEQ